MGEQLPSLHLYTELGQGKERSETGQSALCKDTCCKESGLLDLTKGVSGAGKGPQRSRAGTLQMLP